MTEEELALLVVIGDGGMVVPADRGVAEIEANALILAAPDLAHAIVQRKARTATRSNEEDRARPGSVLSWKW